MLRKKNVCWWILGFVFVLITGCSPQRQTELKEGEKAIILTGKVFPLQESEVMSPVSAIVAEVRVEPGQKVSAGELLARLEDSALRAELRRAQSNLAAARVSLGEIRGGALEAQRAEAEAEVERLRQEVLLQERLTTLSPGLADYEQAGIMLENAKAKLERMYALFGRRLVSQPELDAAENEYAEAWRRFEASREALGRRSAVGDSEVKIARARYQAAQARLRAMSIGSRQGGRTEMARAQLRQAEADFARAQDNLGQTTVVAPISGIVTEVPAQAGNKVYEGRLVAKIVDLSRVKIIADLSPGLLPFVRVGQKAQVTINTVPPTMVSSNVSRIQTVADPDTQSLPTTFILLNPDFKFQPGFTARIEIPVERSSR